MRKFFAAWLVSGALVGLSACGSDPELAIGAPEPAATPAAQSKAARGRTYTICPGRNATSKALIAFFDAREGDTIAFCEGRFEMGTGLLLNGKRGITIKGAGKDRTILSFKTSDSAEGINVSHGDGIVLEGFTTEDTPGNGIRVYRSQFVTLRDVRARWRDAQGRDETQPGYTPRAENGAYGLYPVEARHVLIEDSAAHGASDAGIYVGQTSDVIVRRTLATHNVAGFEFENTYRAVFEDNVATANTGGFLVFDLPGLSQYGEKNIVRRNRAYANNTDNFAPIGNIVGLVPRGTGMLVLASDQLDIYDNEISDNDTLGIAVINFALAEPNEADPKYDFFPEGVAIYRNTFRDNGGQPQEPDLERGIATILPTLLTLRNLGRGAHVVWDGAVDTRNAGCPMPVDQDGIPLDQPNPDEQGEEDRYEARVDERGRPNFQRTDPEPACKYNAWKFDAAGNLRPENRLYVAQTGADSNSFQNTRLTTLLVTPFLRANITSSDEQQLLLDLLLKLPEYSTANYQTPLPPVAVRPLLLPFVPDPANGDARPSKARIAELCGATRPGEVNFSALGEVNCPRLAQYGLFEDAADPRSRGIGAVPYELNTALFSDYSSKYRFLFVPPGQTIDYRDHTFPNDITDINLQAQDKNSTTATLVFPVGTVIAKTFSFRKGAEERVVETRLLIKRQTAQGPSWIGLPYVWTTQGGQRVAELKIDGALTSADYDYTDPDPEVAGNRHYVGRVENYRVPAALTCLSCHAGDDRETGAAPIGPKARNLNRDNDYPEGRINQLRYLQMKGLLNGLPPDLASVERLPRWNVPGDGGELPGSDADVHHRARAYLEVNCLHCHNPAGAASNSGLFLDVFRTVNRQYGICKTPVAAGRGSGGRQFDITPGSAAGSILTFRLASNEAGVRMPPIARSVTHGEAVGLLTSWIDEVLPTPDTQDEEVCNGGGLLPGLLSPLTSADQRREAAFRSH